MLCVPSAIENVIQVRKLSLSLSFSELSSRQRVTASSDDSEDSDDDDAPPPLPPPRNESLIASAFDDGVEMNIKASSLVSQSEKIYYSRNRIKSNCLYLYS